MVTTIAVLVLVMGVGIAGVWTRDIVTADHIDLADGLFAARDPDSGSLFWPHWIAEYATAIGLVIAGIGLLTDAAWAGTATGIASGALLYTSLNSLGWALAEPDRRFYAVPMALGVIVGTLAITHALTT